MEVKAYIDDESEEYLLNLVAQAYFSEAWEFIQRLTNSFHSGLYVVAGRALDYTCDSCQKKKKLKIYGNINIVRNILK